MKYYFDDRAAERVCNFIERYIKHIEGVKAGEYFKLEDWQREDVSNIFGWKREDGTRKYRKAYMQLPRGNGKSTLIGALCNAMMFIDEEPASLVTYGALNQNQANGTGFRIVSEQIRANEKLLSKVKILNNIHAVEYRVRGEMFEGLNIFKTISRAADALHGMNVHFGVIDEYHTHPTSEVLDVIETSMLKRKQPLLVIITTAGFNISSPCYREYLYAKKVQSKEIIDESYYVRIWEADSEADIYSEDTWRAANPNYGVSIDKSYFEQQIQRIKNEPSYENTFRVLHLNQWVNTESSWVSDIDWSKAYADGYKYDDLRGLDAFLAFDLSQTSDITALTLMVKKDDKYHSLNWFWLPREKYQSSADYKNESFYQWVADGFITLCETRAVDYRLMSDLIMKLEKDFNIVNIQYDPYNAAQIAADLERYGFEMHKFRQGFLTMNYPTKKLYEMIVTGAYNHNNNPVLRWMAQNATVKLDEAGNQKIIKDPKQPQRKVDGIITNIMALGAILEHEHNNPIQSYMESGQIWEI